MPASEETYRSQSNLHAIFAVSSVAMMLSTVWMVMADHLRPWKQVQRQFQQIERAKLRVAEDEKLQEQREKYKAQLDAIDAKIKAAQAEGSEHRRQLATLDKEIDYLGGTYERLDTTKKFQKAELDSQRSLYDGMIERGEEREARLYIRSTIVPSEKRLLALSKEFELAERDLKAKKAERERLLGNIDDLKKEKERLTREVDRVKRTIEQKERQHFGLGAWVRALPGIDLMPPTKIQQISLPELTINYNFKDVPRYDRCTTCHQGIDRLGYQTGPDGKRMPPVFASHPHLTDGATTVDPRGKVVKAGLYLDPNGPHPINSFGCTICHGGQGSGTDFTYASHEPSDLKEKHEWEETHHWREIHFWDEPMLPSRFLESSCLKCHHLVTDVPQAETLQAGYRRIVKYGCTGCHTIGGEGSFGPDLTDEKQVGPNLTHVASKVSKEWLLKWVKNPHAFRPDTRMPRFYGLENNDGADDQPKSHAEIHAIAHYLFAKSQPPAGFVDPPAKTDAARGKKLFLEKGCLACHAHRPYERPEIQTADRHDADPGYKPDPAETYDPAQFPESVREYARGSFGPNLSNVAAKFPSKDEGRRWLTNWIKAPEVYHPHSLMPNLQLSLQDAADIADWLVSVPGRWPVAVDVPRVESDEVRQGVDELLKLYVTKGGFRKDGKHIAVPLKEVDSFVAATAYEDKLLFLGEKTISRMGCFGCHTIAGFENTKPIGTPLNGWGTKSPAKLDFAHIDEYIVDQTEADDHSRDGTDLYYQEKIADRTRNGFLYQKIHRPRSYDYKKAREDLKAWDDRLRMPRFAFADDPKAVEEVMTFVLGLTGEKIAARYLPRSHYRPSQTALAQGTKLLNRYNCTGCHVVEMPRYALKAGARLEEALPSFATNVSGSYRARVSDYLATFYMPLTYDPKADPKNPPELKPQGSESFSIEGMPVGLFEDELTVQLWKPVTIRGYTFNVGDNLTLDRTKVDTTPAVGGRFAWLYATDQADRTGSDFAAFWNRLPPPLIREGNKVQTPWLMGFLRDPYPIRPATNLRMPRFHFGKTSETEGDRETSELADFFAARDGAEFPYQLIPQRTREYLAEREEKHKNYLGAGWQLATKGACIQCHAIGPYKPTGGDQVVNGPDLRQVATRFRPEFLQEWLANPRRLIPYTAMPQNIPPQGPPPPGAPKGFEDHPLDMVTAVRDTLLNYVSALEQQLVEQTNPDKPAQPPKEKTASD